MGVKLKDRGWYGKGSWKRARMQALNRDHWLCQECLRQGRVRTAKEVHHLKPLELYPELGLELDNLESLCRECHEATKDKSGFGNGPARRKAEKNTPKGVRIIKI